MPRPNVSSFSSLSANSSMLSAANGSFDPSFFGVMGQAPEMQRRRYTK